MNHRQLLTHQAWSVTASVITGLMSIVTTAMVVRLLGVEGYGAVGLTVSVASMIGMLQNFGIAAATSREVAQAKLTREIPKIILSSLIFRAVVSLPLIGGLYLLADYLAVDMYSRPYLAPLIRLSALLFLSQEIFAVFDASLRGMQKFRSFALLKVLFSMSRFGILFLCVHHWSTAGWFIGETVICVLMILSNGLLILRGLCWTITVPTCVEIRFYLKKIWEMSFVVFFTKIAISIWLKLPIVVLGFVGGDAAIGVLNLGLELGGRFRTIGGSVAAINLPYLSRVFENDKSKFRELFQKNYNTMFAMLCVGLGTIFAFQKEILPLIFGNEFSVVVTFFPQLLFVFFVMQIVNIMGSGALFPTGNFKGIATLHIIWKALSAVLILVVILSGMGTNELILAILPGTVIPALIYQKRIRAIFAIDFWPKELCILFALMLTGLAIAALDMSLAIRASVFMANLIVAGLLVSRLTTLKAGVSKNAD